jgi:hypothetical protein
MEKTLDIVLLLALPASGKSEVRRYLANVPEASLRRDFHIGETLQIDDFPYVHLMRRIDDELAALGKERVFFKSGDKPFKNPKDWGTLIHLINEDYADLMAKKVSNPASAGLFIMERIEKAAELSDIDYRLDGLDGATKEAVAGRIEAECRKLLDEKHAAYPASFDGKTIVIEAARGGAHGSSMPLQAPFGYKYSLAQLSPEILKRAVILYVWVTPEESRRKNAARTDPNDPGSILHHGVPMDVMMGDYGCDDMDWLEQNSDKPGTIAIEAHGGVYHLPIGRFDNRVDKTSFLREDKAKWSKTDVAGVHEGIRSALDKVFRMQN